MTVTSGFYVRSLCHDLGMAVDSLAFMASLVRTRQGDFELGKNVLEYGDLEKGEEVWGSKVQAMLEEWQAKEGVKMVGSEPSGKRKEREPSPGRGRGRGREDERSKKPRREKERERRNTSSPESG
jgi:tRNA pseudouridine55 synthase